MVYRHVESSHVCMNRQKVWACRHGIEKLSLRRSAGRLCSSVRYSPDPRYRRATYSSYLSSDPYCRRRKHRKKKRRDVTSFSVTRRVSLRRSSCIPAMEYCVYPLKRSTSDYAPLRCGRGRTAPAASSSPSIFFRNARSSGGRPPLGFTWKSTESEFR